MIYLFRWLFGYVEFSFKSGFAEDFLTDCFSKNIELQNITVKEDYVTACCNVKYYKRLHRIAYAHGGTVKIIKKKGLPFLLLPLKNRYGFFVGIVCFCAIISFLSSFIWQVEIVGNDRVSTASIITYLEKNNLKKGTMWGAIDRDRLCWKMMSDFEDFSWVHINKQGTTARIEISETSPQPDTSDAAKLQGVNVFRRELSVTVNREQKNIKLKKTKAYYRLHFFTADIPLYLKKEKGSSSAQSSKFLEIKDITLPIGYTEYEESFYEAFPETLTDEELKKLARKRLSFEEQKEFDGFEIINKAENVKIDESECTVSASYIIRRK